MREEGHDRWNSGFRLCAALSSSVRIAAQEQRFRLSLRRLITWWRLRNTHVPAGRTREEAENLRISAPTDGWKECSARVPTARAEDRALDSKRDAKRASREGRTRRGGGGRRRLRELPNFRPRTHAALSPEDTAGSQVSTLPQVHRPASTESHQRAPRGTPGPRSPGHQVGSNLRHTLMTKEKRRERQRSWEAVFFKKKSGLQMGTPKLKETESIQKKAF